MVNESTVEVEVICDGCGDVEYNSHPEGELTDTLWTDREHCDICGEKTKHLYERLD